MFKGAVGLILLMQICVAEVLFANIKEIEPNFERFMLYFEGIQTSREAVKNTKMAGTIASILNVSGVSPVQKQKLLFKLGQIHCPA